jgi:TetR/AcrR family transcriptional regulator, regulator of autoinduction and epiphytic fitness
MEAGVTQAQPAVGTTLGTTAGTAVGTPARSGSRETHVDPRVERSRAVITAAATDLLMQGGVHAVTVDAVIARSGVARSTIYRHFPASTDLLAAAFDQLLPPVPEAPAAGTFPERLLGLMLQQSAMLRDAPTTVVMTAWLVVTTEGMKHAASASPHFSGLQQRLLEHHSSPLSTLLRSGLERRELRQDLDVDVAVSQLGGPLVFRKLISMEPVDEEFCRRVVEDFLRANLAPQRSAAET